MWQNRVKISHLKHELRALLPALYTVTNGELGRSKGGTDRDGNERMSRSRLEWFGHVRIRNETESARAVVELKMEGKRSGGRPMLGGKDTVKRHDCLRYKT